MSCTLLLMLASGAALARPGAAAPEAPARARAEVAPRAFSGPDQTAVDVLRPFPGASRIFVQVGYPDGGTGVFMVDTGADVSVLSADASERLALPSRGEVRVWGLSGTATAHRAVLPEIRIGEITVPTVEVLVGVPGVSSQAGFLPVDGLLGNNVWGRFVLEIDYPADTLVLHAPGTVKLPSKARPMHFDGSHVHTEIALSQPDGGEPVRIVTQVDTGAGELTLCAATGLPFEQWTQGLESVRGIGASETLPPYRFLETTRRIPLKSVSIGGREVELELPARWMNFEDVRATTCGGGMRALLGHEYLAGSRVFFDYPGGRLALTRSKRAPRQLDGHRILLEQEVAAHGTPPERGLIRGRFELGAGELEAAVTDLRAFVPTLASPEDKAEARVLLAQVLRSQGQHEEAWEVLDGMSAGDLVDQDQIVGMVNGLVFEGDGEQALALATDAVTERPDDGWAHVALADVLFSAGRLDDAQAELLEAARLEQYPDAHLLRRARVSLAAGDRYGSMAHVRKLLKLYPAGGPYLWFYAMLLEDDADRSTFRADLEAAMGRLHPFMQPFDFLVASHHVLGDEARVEDLLAQGLHAHCDPMPDQPEKDNCVAWYEALAGVRLDDALQRIDRALEQTGPRSDFLDTKGMVHLARGEAEQARTAALGAARLAPDDVYMIWQAERIAQIASRGVE